METPTDFYRREIRNTRFVIENVLKIDTFIDFHVRVTRLFLAYVVA